MTAQDTATPPLLDHLATLPGLRSSGFQPQTILTDRRGVALVRGHLPDGRPTALKLVTPGAEPSGPYDPIEMLNRETKWLCKYGTELAQGSYISDGLALSEHWLLLEWQEGAPLDRWMRDHKTTPPGPVFGAAARAVARLHNAGQVHGDLQPAHVLVDEDQRIALIDFSLAHVPGDFNFRGAMVHFMAPETAAAMRDKRAAVIDPLSEIYAFGAVLFFAATGKVPTGYADPKAPVGEKIAAIADQGCSRADLLRDQLPPELAAIILQCLERRRGDRAQSLDTVATRLSARA